MMLERHPHHPSPHPVKVRVNQMKREGEKLHKVIHPKTRKWKTMTYF
jgi:hypothetical protein